MTAYYIVFILTLVLCMVIPSHRDKQYILKLIIVFLPLFLFGALRLDFSLDYSQYELLWKTLNTTKQVDHSAHVEVGYQWLNIIVPSWRLMLILTAFMTTAALAFLMYKTVERDRLILALCLIFLAGNFMIFTPFATMRNGITIAIMLFCFPLIRDRRMVFVIIIAFLAHYIHSSILLFLPIAYFVGSDKAFTATEIKRWVAGLIAILLIGASRLLDVVGLILNKYFGMYEEVVEYMKGGMGHSSILVIIANTVIFAVMIYEFYLNRKSLCREDNVLFRIGLIYLLCPFLGSLGGARTQCYFIPFFLLSVVRLSSLEWKSPLLKKGFYCFIFAYYFYTFFYVWQWNNPYFTFKTYHSIIGDF